MAHILAIGIATLDVINSVKVYPAEDDEIRAVSQRLCRGGNATNSLTVLSQLEHQCYWAGVLADEANVCRIETDLKNHQINTAAVLKLTEGKVPTSYITHNLSNGSRTIVHFRDLPEYPFNEFQKIDLSQFDWLHFEGRNVVATRQMLVWAKQQAPNLPCSVEIEKQRDDIEVLFELADVVFFSKAFAQAQGHTNAPSLLNAQQAQCGNAKLTCTWGESGAWALDGKQVLHSPAFPPSQLIDTLGAGDTFNAGIIDALVRGQGLGTALHFACRLAGQKCGQQGLDGLRMDAIYPKRFKIRC